MRTGVSTASLFMRENNEEALPLLDALGVRTAEVFLTSFSEYDRNFGELLAEKKGRVRVHSVHVLNTQFEPQLFSGNPRVKKDAFFWLERAMRAGQALGAKYYTFHGIARIKRASRSGEKDNFAAWGGGLREISEFPVFCARRGNFVPLFPAFWISSRRGSPLIRIRCISKKWKGALRTCTFRTSARTEKFDCPARGFSIFPNF